ncbi:MAG TPA: TonB-dependent receptor [Phenylobacterium sp.]|nr:TonB-dependent receptor [Phenylobacterium sp.]
MRTRIWLASSTAIGLALALTAPAWAAGPAAPQFAVQQAVSTDDASGSAVKELVITAQKREQSVQDVPLAVSAFSSKQRDVIGIASAQDLVKFTPSMSFSENPKYLYIRGIGQSSTAPGVEAGVALYYDGIYTGDNPANTSFLGSSSLLVDRIEVLRGPQGTLYGHNTNGGAVNIISKRPTDDFEEEVRGEVANYDVFKGGASISGPINDKLRFRIAGTYDWQGKGYTHNLDGPDPGTGGVAHIEAQLDADVTPDLNLWVKYAHEDVRQYALTSSVIAPYDTTTPSFDGFIQINPLWGYNVPNPSVTNHRLIAQNTPATFDSTEDTIAVNAAWTIGDFATLKYLGGYTTAQSHVMSDLDNSGRSGNFIYDGPLSSLCDPATHYGCVISPVDVANTHASGWSYSNELDLISKGEHRFNWVLGLYQISSAEPYDIELERPLQSELTSLPGNPGGSYISSIGGATGTSYAVFGQVDYSLTKTLTLEGGLRYTYDEKEVSSGLPQIVFYGPLVLTGAFAGANGPGTCTATAVCALSLGPTASFSKNFGGVTGRVALQWRPDHDTNVYALISTGYKAGVITEASPAAWIPPEQLTDYEAGVKREFGRTLSLNLAAFYYDYKHIQVQTNGPDPNVPGNFTQVWISAPKARTYGFEAEGVWQPTEAIDVHLVYSFLDGKLLELNNVVDIADPGKGVQNVSGNPLPQTPKNTVTVDAGYTWRFDPGSLRASITNTFTAKRYYDIFATPTYEGKPYDQLSLRAVWNSADGKFTAIAYLDNVTNQESVNYVSLSGSSAAPAWLLNPPRTFGIELQRRF